MLEKIIELLEGIPAVIIAGIFLLMDLVPHLISEFGGTAIPTGFLPFDPSWVTVLICGIPILIEAVSTLVSASGISKISSELLVSIAMIAAIAIGDLFAAGEIAFIMAIGEILEEKTTERAKKGLKRLISLSPTQGRRITDGREEMLPAEEIRCGDILRILPGETVPVDGIIVHGETSVDQSILTGESMPVDKAENDSVYSGTINRFGSIDIRAVRTGKDSSLKKLIRMVEEAEDKKAPMARIADVAASRLVPVSLLIAVITGLISGDIVRAVTVLVVFCPCALVLATPTAIMAAIGQAARKGVIIKSGEALENMSRVHTVAFDKTGTLTYGHPEVSDVVSFSEDTDERALLSMAASAEMRSEHPLGKAIISHVQKHGIKFPEPEEFKMNAGRGVFARVCGKELFLGSESFLNENGIYLSENESQRLELLLSGGKALVLAAEKTRVLGVIALSDVIRPEAGEIVESLHRQNVEIMLLTGDNRKAADFIAEKAGIRNVKAQLLPEEKVAAITAVMNDGKAVCMVGDGVNDAPALKTATVGVAMGGLGSDIAAFAADVVLMNDDISGLPYLKRLSVAAVKTIRFSIGLSMAINLAAVALSVLGMLNPTAGALVHNAGSVFVVLTAALLYDRKI